MNIDKKTAVVLIGSHLSMPDIEYATGFHSSDPVVLVAHAGRRYLAVPRMEVGRARAESRNTEVLTPAELGLQGRSRASYGHWAAAILKRLRVGKCYVPSEFPHGAVRVMEKQGVKVRILTEEPFPERRIKSSAETKKIKESQQAAVLAMRAAINAISRAGIDSEGFLVSGGRRLTSECVRQLISRVLMDHSCVCRDTIVACGPDAADPHNRGYGPLKANSAIVMDIFPQHLEHGYWGDLSRTVLRGTANDEITAIYSAVKAAQAVALHAIKPGVKCGTIHNQAKYEFNRRGFKTEMTENGPAGFIHSVGHGVGLEVHEKPSLGSDEGRLRKGNVVTVEPGLYYPGVGGVRIEDTVVVTAKGWRYLVPCEKKLLA